MGSITALIDSSGNIVQTYRYDSFGNIITSTGSLTQPYTYTGREYDSETGLYYFRARYMNPKTGRFLQEDPIWFDNLYAYCGNNPLNLVDPYGYCSIASGKNNVPSWMFALGALSIATPYPGDEEIIWASIGIYVGAVLVRNAWDDIIKYNPHTKNQRPSSLPKHEEGLARKQRDSHGGEKGDNKRQPYGKRPPNWKGPWPPK